MGDRDLARLKRESVKSLGGLYLRLKALSTDTMEPLVQGYGPCTEWTRDIQIRMLLRRARSENIVLSNDPRFLTAYGEDLVRATRRVRVSLVVEREMPVNVPSIKRYVGGNDIESLLFHHGEEGAPGLAIKVLFIPDRRESLSVIEDRGTVTGTIICPDIFAGYLSRKTLQEIQPVRPSHGSS
jgi:hypothetical protein